MRKILFLMIYILAFSILGRFIYKEYDELSELEETKGGFTQAISNYKNLVEDYAEQFDLAPSYLMALIMLESSGKKKVPVRYEKGIYNHLLLLKQGKIEKFENMVRKDVKSLSKKKLKELASSYGPMQIMGYKCFYLNIPLDSLKGKNNLYFAIKWIDTTYGEMVRDGEYQDAFHMHNAGKKYPKNGKPTTHDPNYVKNGLLYEKYFRKVVFN